MSSHEIEKDIQGNLHVLEGSQSRRRRGEGNRGDEAKRPTARRRPDPNNSGFYRFATLWIHNPNNLKLEYLITYVYVASM
jgi:hypothetical protein